MRIVTKDNSDLSKPPKKPKEPRKAIRRVSFKNSTKEQAAKRLWYSLNPPDQNGQWECYLSIHPWCPKMVDEFTIVQEHVKPKKTHPELKYEHSNRRAACEFCNGLKDCLSLERVIELYPDSKIAIAHRQP